MTKPRILSVKKKEKPAEGVQSPAALPPAAPARPRVLEEADWSLLLQQVREREEQLKKQRPPSSLEEVREQALKDILPPEVGPGVPLEFAKRKVREAMDRARGRGKRGGGETGAVQA